MTGASAGDSVLLNVDDYEEAARACLEAPTFDYYAGGSYDEITFRENHRAYDRIRLRYRVLRDCVEP